MIITKENFTQETLKRLQLSHIEILDEVVRICDNNGLKYYLAEGTLLGAVRHKAHIPWDDDLDIAMPRADFNKFAQLCKTELPNKFLFQFVDTVENHYLLFAKVRNQETVLNEYNIRNLDVPKGIYIDIFPIDNTKKLKSISRNIRTKIIKKLSFFVTAKVGFEYNSSFLREISLFLLKPFSVRSINKFRQFLMCVENKEESDYYINFASYKMCDEEIFKKSDFGEGVYLEFEGKSYRAPKNYDKILKTRYGNYMELPPVEERILKHKPEYIDFGD